MEASRGANRSGQSALSPIFRWAGSKRKLIPQLLRHMPENYERYIEPFGGSACFFFQLRPRAALLGDFNPHLIQAYMVIKHHPILLTKALVSLEDQQIDYYELRKQDPLCLSDIDRAARFIFLNRHCFNGVYRTNKQGQFNVPKGTRVGSLPTRHHVLRCSYALRSAQLLNADFEETIEAANSGDFVYMDPPYAKHSLRLRGEYGYGAFGVSDIARLNQALVRADNRNVKFLLSYVECDEIRLLQEQWNFDRVHVNRQVSGFQEYRQVVTEVLITNQVHPLIPK